MHITHAAYNRLRKRVAKATGRKLPACPAGPNINEQRFARTILAGRGEYEPVKIAITDSGRIYTPDYSFAGPSRPAYIEVKGAYRSKKDERLICDRSRLAWEVAGDRNPEYDWVWAKYERGGYLCELRSSSIPWRIQRFCRTAQDFVALLGGAGDPK